MEIGLRACVETYLNYSKSCTFVQVNLKSQSELSPFTLSIQPVGALFLYLREKYLRKVTDVEAMDWIEKLYGQNETGAERSCPAPANKVLVDLVKKDEKFQNRISLGSSPYTYLGSGCFLI